MSLGALVFVGGERLLKWSEEAQQRSLRRRCLKSCSLLLLPDRRLSLHHGWEHLCDREDNLIVNSSVALLSSLLWFGVSVCNSTIVNARCFLQYEASNVSVADLSRNKLGHLYLKITSLSTLCSPIVPLCQPAYLKVIN